MTVTFNIVFTDNTVQYLWLFPHSVLRHSGVKLRLIGNFISSHEESYLKKIVGENENLSYFPISTEAILSHHEVLNITYKAFNDESFFCFMDSDILSTGDFLADLNLESLDACYSCKPIWSDVITPEKNFHYLQGRHIYSNNKNILCGTSYFACYRRESTDFIMDKYGIDFRRYSWDDLSPEIQKLFRENELQYELYDTAKVLNLLLHFDSFRTEYIESPSLFHIGGMSWNKSIFEVKQKKDDSFLHVKNEVLRTQLTKRRATCKFYSELIQELIEGKDVSEYLKEAKQLGDQHETITMEIIHNYNLCSDKISLHFS